MHIIVERTGPDADVVTLTIHATDEDGRDTSVYLSPPRLRALEQQLAAARRAIAAEAADREAHPESYSAARAAQPEEG